MIFRLDRFVKVIIVFGARMQKMKKLTITFEQVSPHFHKWAKHFCNKYFDYWELINSAWCYGKVRFLPQSKIRYASARIKYDMIDYMRDVSLFRRKKIRLSKGKTFPHINNFTDLTSPREGGNGFETTLTAKNVDIEQKDFMGFFVNHPSLSRTEKLIMKLMYLSGCNQTEVSKVCGFTESHIYKIHSNIIERFRSLDYSKVI